MAIPTWGWRVYRLCAVIGGFELLRDRVAGLQSAAVAMLRQGLALVPVTDLLPKEPAAAASRRSVEPTSDEPFVWMSPVFERTLREWSRHGPVGCVEADFFGGDGWQNAVAWRDGARVWGPAYDKDFSGPRRDWPINGVLALLGAAPSRQMSRHNPGQPAYDDLFQEIGLGWERDMDGWRRAGRAGRALGYDLALAKREEEFRADAEYERRRELDRLPAVLDGDTIMEILGVRPGPVVGEATRHLKELALEHGALTREEAVAGLRAWAPGRVTGSSV
ncbi:hypothetical protein ACWY4P_17235 [Streptomyces sp. LZ34]